MPARKFYKRFIVSFAVTLVVLGGLLVTGLAWAQTTSPDLGLTEVGDTIGLPDTDVRLVAANIIRTALSLLGIIALALMLYAGYMWTTAGGNEDRVLRAKKILINSAIGLAIILSAYAVTSFVIGRLLDATGPGGGTGTSTSTPGGGGGYLPGNVFYVVSAPPGGAMCIRNIKPSITFNKDVDLGTLTGNIVLERKSDGTAVAGSWSWQATSNKRTALFTPTGSCGIADGGNDCLAATTDYTFNFKTPQNVKSLPRAGEQALSLSCTFTSNCNTVTLTTGSGIDRNAPKITGFVPQPPLQLGRTIPVEVTYQDDNGLQKIDLEQGGNLIDSVAIPGCKTSGTVTINWPTTSLTSGAYTLKATAYDKAMLNHSTTTQATLRPQHCFDNKKDPGEVRVGPPACGGDCGACESSSCRSDKDCSSGYCEIPGGTLVGVCLDKMRINRVSPGSGAVRTFVTISGKYFGKNQGRVYFAKVKNPSPANLGDWAIANPASCGSDHEWWTTDQIVVQVPTAATSGPIMVTTDDVIVDGKTRRWTDTTNDSFGPLISDFEINSIVRPGLCSATPDRGLAGIQVDLKGKDFGPFKDTLGKVMFGPKVSLTSNARWSDTSVSTTVPFGLAAGEVSVQVTDRKGVGSNAVRFIVRSGVSKGAPFISDITPSKGAKGEYLTITGENFGDNRGQVWFKSKTDFDSKSFTSVPTILGDFNFPSTCTHTWSDKKIVVKFPKDKGDVGETYYVQVSPASAGDPPSDIPGPTFDLEGGDPKPGICEIDPNSGPVPFSAKLEMKITGEHFGPNPEVYFWTTGATSNTTTGRLRIDSSDVKVSGNEITVAGPPAGTKTGPVIVYNSRAQAGKRMSNELEFEVSDCTESGSSCSTTGFQCCKSGFEKGVCRPTCEDETVASAYIWRFSSQGITPVPRVVERCEAGSKLLPTPSPSVQWDFDSSGDHHNICRSASVIVEFSLPNVTGLDNNSVVVNKCVGSRIDKNDNSCEVASRVNVRDLLGSATNYTLQRASDGSSYLQLNPDTGAWDDDAWYQVALTTDVQVTSGTLKIALAKDQPCGNIGNSAYCFLFKTNSQDCKLDKLLVTPHQYRTTILEEPITGLVYNALGLSTQRCVIMNTNGLKWQWDSANTTYATIFGGSTNQTAQVSALANTVGVGLPDDSVNINVAATTGTKRYTASSPLTIDLSSPEVVDYWPTCLETCTNAAVGIRFNTDISERNLNNFGAVKLEECLDDNCFTTNNVTLRYKTELDFDSANNAILDIKATLKGDTRYKVTVSASSTDPLDPRKIWSRASISDPGSSTKPYNKEFSWTFQTKKDDCKIDRVEVAPTVFKAKTVTDRTVFRAKVYGKPDKCSTAGQLLDSRKVDWKWTSSDEKVAEVKAVTTFGSNRFCTNRCIKKGSDIPFGINNVPVCGNGRLEAGEDCDGPNKAQGCSLNCLRMGNTKTTGPASCGDGTVDVTSGEECDPGDPATKEGCSDICLHLGSKTKSQAKTTSATQSICGSGKVGSGEDCDTGISGTHTNPQSALLCSSQCLHLGTKLSTAWCQNNDKTLGGFTKAEYDAACKASLSWCGDGIDDPDEDVGCDQPSGQGRKDATCNNRCLQETTKTECVAGSEGCSSTGQHLGSSLLYSTPSFCGDKVVGIGEDASCETSNLVVTNNNVNPWTLAIGVGQSTKVSGTPPAQTADIKAASTPTTLIPNVSGQGQFTVTCGFQSDSQCQAGFGVGSNSCCYQRPTLTKVYPGTTSTFQTDVCPNTSIEAEFDKLIDAGTLADNVIVARGYTTASASNCSGSKDVTKLVGAFSDGNDSPWYVKLVNRVANFFRSLFGHKAAAAPGVVQWCSGDDVGTSLVTETSSSTSKISVKLTAPLATNTPYLIILKEGVRDRSGVSIGKNPSDKPWNWEFSTSRNVCAVDKISLKPKTVYFSKYGATSKLEAEALTDKGAKIQPIKGFYDWRYLWEPFTNNFVTLSSSSTDIGELTLTSKNRDGEVDVRSSVTITTDRYGGKLGPVATASDDSRVIVFLCENPWPPKDHFIGTVGPLAIFPYEDVAGNNDGFDLTVGSFNDSAIPSSPVGGYFNFSTYYCADNGSFGTADDLPYLRPAVQVSPKVVSANTTLKRFLFTNIKNNDAIGIQIFPNNKHLSLRDWYQTEKGFSGSLRSTQVDGYDALTDGNNYYVDALNYTSDKPGGSLFTNVYLFSINADAQPDTKKVFTQLIKNVKFNINLTNFGFCGTTIGATGASTSCKSDLDCKVPGEFCSNQVDKLKRNYQRLKDLRFMKESISTSTPPELKEGTFLSGQAVSVWPSWSRLGSAVSKVFSTDPVNKLGKAGTCKNNSKLFCTSDSQCPGSTCAFHDPVTGWSVEDRRFSFACSPDSLAYRYLTSKTDGYNIRARFEDPFGSDPTTLGTKILNWNDLLGGKPESFLDKRFIVDQASGICLNNKEISTLNRGSCGDGVVGPGEQCEPPSVKYGSTSACTGASTVVTRDTCGAVGSANACQWIRDTISCTALSVCGNGAVEFGEVCDDGARNGKYNSCNKLCSGKVRPLGQPMVHNPAESSPGFCGDGQAGKNEFCDHSVAGFSLYDGSAANKDKTCSADCQNIGRYCGDGIVQNDTIDGTSIGASEDCDSKAVSCTLKVGTATVAGEQACNSSCKLEVCKEVKPSTSVAQGTCGDGKVDKDEACDRGADNGKVCTPTYGKSCAYCAADCRNVIDVQPKEYCGNGIIEASEVCDADPITKVIYAANSNTSTTKLSLASGRKGYEVLACLNSPDSISSGQYYKKGTRNCVNECQKLEDNCVNCGVNTAGGVNISGQMVNVIDPKSTNPLKVAGNWGTLDLVVNPGFTPSNPWAKDPAGLGPKKVAFQYQNWSGQPTFPISNQYTLHMAVGGGKPAVPALINSNTVCSTGEEPKYKLLVNADIPTLRNFPIFSQKTKSDQPWIYDLLLSPVIRSSVRPSDVRVVVSWTDNTQFIGGLKYDNYRIAGGSFVAPEFVNTSLTEGSQFLVKVGGQDAVVTGDNYYTQTSKAIKFIWYHGFNKTTNKLSSESFTIFKTGDRLTGNTVFYVRVPSGGISKYRNSNLKVEVYLPRNSSNPRAFDVPHKTYFLTAADSSANPTASYWQVFNFNHVGSTAGSADVIPIGTSGNGAIVSGPKFFRFK